MSSARRITVVGDLVLDRDVEGVVDRVAPDAPVPVVDVEHVHESPGAAGLAALLCRAGHDDVTLVAPVAEDQAGARLTRSLEDAGVRVLRLRHLGDTRTKTRVRAAGQSLVRVDAGGPGTPEGGELPVEVRERLAASTTVLVSDYGAGTAADPALRTLLQDTALGTRVVWDPHPRGPEPVEGCALVTPNLAEARAVLSAQEQPGTAAARLRERWRAGTVAVTCGASGAWLSSGGQAPLYVPAPRAVGDPCGAGDQFAATAVVALTHGALPSEAVAEAVAAASRWVAAGGAESFHRDRSARACGADPPDPGAADPGAGARAVVARTRARGGTVVATGGCFDILHAGHVASLSAARALGDCLVVLLNSDASVRRLKGRGRPVHTAADRAAVLASLRSVDAVLVFDEDDPTRALRELRPDVWAKGGDYDVDALPESSVVRGWGGQAVGLPYLDGHSTTQILGVTT